MKTFAAIALTVIATASILAQPAPARFEPASKVFRLDGGAVSYVFGVNPRGELQQIYWGGRLGAGGFRFSEIG